MYRTLKDWLIVMLSLLDDLAVALFLILMLWLFGVPISLIIIFFTVVFFVIYAFIAHILIIPAMRKRVTTGKEGLVDLQGLVIEALKPIGLVKVNSEYWKAQSLNGEIHTGEKVKIVSINGLILNVDRLDRKI